MVTASVSTFHDHNATPAAVVAARRCFSCHTGIVISLTGPEAVTPITPFVWAAATVHVRAVTFVRLRSLRPEPSGCIRSGHAVTALNRREHYRALSHRRLVSGIMPLPV